MSDRKGFIGIGKESVDGEIKVTTWSYPLIQTHEEQCEICEAICPRDDMHFVGSDEHGEAIYVCGDAHERRT